MSSIALKRKRHSGRRESKIRVEHLENGCTRYVAGPDARVGDVVVVGGKRVPVLNNDGLREIVARWRNDHSVGLVHVCTSHVTDMTDLFNDASDFNQDIGGWDTSNVTDMSGMFCYVYYFNQDISGWNTSNVRNMCSMFYKARVFNQGIGEWDTSNVIDMSCMFQRTYAFNKDIRGWNTSNVTNMSYMFYGAVAFNKDISGWNTSNVTNMSYMFNRARAFNHDISGWEMPQAAYVRSMLYGATSYSMPRDNIPMCAFFRSFFGEYDSHESDIEEPYMEESDSDESDSDESDNDESVLLPRIDGTDAPRTTIECPICTVHVPQVVCIPCGHASCISCHQRCTKPTCPNCRATVSMYHRLFL